MSTAIQKSILQRVRDFLGINGELSATELHRELRGYLTEIQPDRFSDDAAKKAAESKFNEAEQLLAELFQFIQNEATQKSPSELCLFKPVYDGVFLQHALDASKKEIKDLKIQLERKEDEIGQLKTSLKKTEDEKFESERKRIEKMYKPSATKWASLGIMFALSVLAAAMTKVKDVSEFILQYSPFPQNFMNTTIFMILIVMVILTLKQYVENLVLRRKLEDICSARFTVDFVDYLARLDSAEAEKPKRFTEANVFDFISGKRSRWKAFLGHVGFRIFQTRTDESLKNCFINHLLKKELVQVSHADGLDRFFTINRTRYW
jgi:hypothetical protein